MDETIPNENLAPGPLPPATHESLLRTVFLGPSGLRAGWRFGIYVAAFYALATLFSYALSLLISAAKLHGSPQLWTFLLGECSSFVAAILPAFAMSRLEGRPMGSYGLTAQGAFGIQFWQGLVWGIVSISALLLVMRGAGVFYYGRLAIHGATVIKYAAFWALLFLMVGLFEEFLVRGYTQFTLTDGMGFWPAAVLLSFVFGALHLRQELALGDHPRAWSGVLAAAFIGLFFCLTLRRTGRLWFAIGMHASWDWGQTFLYSVPDSGTVAPGHLLTSSFHGDPWLTGGPIGPEASLLVFLLISVMWVLFDRMYPARARTQTEMNPTPSPQAQSREIA